MPKVTIVNLKCEGCARSITEALSQAGFSDVSVDQEINEVSFNGDKEKACQVLEKLGYPEAGSAKAESLLKKAKSFVSCARGRMKK